MGIAGRALNDQPLSLHVLKERDRKLVERCPLLQPAASYDARPDKSADAALPWNPSLTAKYQTKFFADSDMVLNRAWQEIPGSILVGLTEQVRTRVLRFVLELKDNLPAEATSAKEVPPAIIERSVINHIYGGSILIAAHAEHMSQLEKRVQRLLFDRSIAIARRDLKDIYIWANKILLGIVYAERLFPLNRRYPKGRPIFPPELGDAFNMTHFLIQSLRFPIKFTAEGEERMPGSVFLFDLKSPKDRKLQFDFKDNLFTLGVSIRMGNRGIVTLSDGGAIDLSIGDLLRRDGKRKLHPIQFYELAAKAFYKATLLNRTPKYIMVEIKKAVEIMQMPLMGLSAKPAFDDWDPTAYAHMLSFFTGHSVKTLKPDDSGRVMTFITGAKGKPFNIPLA